MNYIDLFSGIGGFALGAYWAGMKFDKHYFSEVEPYAVELYRKRCPDAIPLGDITKVDWQALADTDRTWELQQEGCQQEERKRVGDGDQTEWIITGGFPCQDLSVAGKGAGLEGSRSGLWTAMFEAIRILRPRYVIIENVGAIIGWFPRIPTGQPPDNAIHLEDGRRRMDVEQYQAIEPVLNDLNSIFYDAEGQDIRAEDMGAPHKRERIWIVANPDRKHVNNAGHGTSEICRERSEQAEVQRCVSDSMRSGRGPGERPQGRSYIEVKGLETIPNSTEQGLQGQKPESTPSRGKQGLLAECNRSRPGEWLPEPCMGVLVDGLPAGLDRFEGRLSNKSYKGASQIKGIGNSILSQMAELLFRRIKELLLIGEKHGY